MTEKVSRQVVLAVAQKISVIPIRACAERLFRLSSPFRQKLAFFFPPLPTECSGEPSEGLRRRLGPLSSRSEEEVEQTFPFRVEKMKFFFFLSR